MVIVSLLTFSLPKLTVHGDDLSYSAAGSAYAPHTLAFSTATATRHHNSPELKRMPRRPAPSALHLVKGPAPARGEPRHTLPAPPQPVFQPKTITKPRSSSTASRNRVDAPLLTFIGPDPTDKSSVDGVMFESPIERGYIPQWDANPVAVTGVNRRTQPGPWDRTRVNALPQAQIAELIAVPKPVAANPVPLWQLDPVHFWPKMFNFGSTAAKPATTGFGGSLFGQPNTAQTTPAAPATTGGLFGATNTTGQPTSAPATTTGGMFGSTQPAAGSTTAGGGLFGGQQPGANTTTGTTGGLFGAQPAANTGGLFGAQPATSTATAGGLFGAQPGANTTAGTTGSSFGFGAPAATAAPVQPAAQASGPFTRTTKFNDLPDAQKRVFEEIESFIQGRVQISVELKAQKLGEEIAKEQAALDELNKSLSAASSALSSDRLAADDQRTKTDRNLQDALVATRIIDGFTKPQQMGGYLTSYANFPLEYFTRQVEEMKERVQRYKSTMEQIERKLAQVYEANSAQPAQPSPQAIANALRAQHASFMALAARTAEIDAAVQKHKAAYTARWRAQTGSARDPFAPASKEDDTLDALMSMSVSVAGR
ncbi:unnamed protein product [Rhizoctonia solani]|uniref:Uncharacterized protein n=1 Tax=Rhizoctonia solani TaxID=456999 RepID=A0A8H3AKK7_9AGAM|nr:unnamed protein product [Rhizoctonia solani]